MLFITVAFLIIAIIGYVLYLVASMVPLYHAVNIPNQPNMINYHIISNLPNKALSNASSTNAIQSIVSFYKDAYEQAFINACENVRWFSIKNNCSNPQVYHASQVYNQAWGFLPSLTGSVSTITGSITPFSCNTRSAFGQYVLHSSISGLQSNTCVYCYYNLYTSTSIPYSMPLPYKINSPYGTNTTHSLTGMGDPCAVGSFISCTYVCG